MCSVCHTYITRDTEIYSIVLPYVLGLLNTEAGKELMSLLV